jgi:hypothetical protein
MNRSYHWSPICSTLALALPLLLSAQSNGKKLQGLLPAGRVNVEVLEMWSPPKLAELTQRLQQAAQADPTWFQEQVRQAVPGQPLPYHPKLGLTESEYREFLALSDSVQMKPVRTALISVEPTRVGWRFGIATSLAALQNVEIDTVTNVVRSPFGELGAAEPITPSDEQQATGPWGGPRWRLEAVDTTTMSGSVAQLAIGKHLATGRTVIYYDARRLDKGQLAARESLFLLVVR